MNETEHCSCHTDLFDHKMNETEHCSCHTDLGAGVRWWSTLLPGDTLTAHPGPLSNKPCTLYPQSLLSNKPCTLYSQSPLSNKPCILYSQSSTNYPSQHSYPSLHSRTLIDKRARARSHKHTHTHTHTNMRARTHDNTHAHTHTTERGMSKTERLEILTLTTNECNRSHKESDCKVERPPNVAGVYVKELQGGNYTNKCNRSVCDRTTGCNRGGTLTGVTEVYVSDRATV